LIQYRRHGSNVSPDKSQGWILMLAWRIRLFGSWMLRIISRRFRLNNVKNFLVDDFRK